MLSGGSAFGLDAAAGVMDWLLEAGRGFTVGPAMVPIVPAAILVRPRLSRRGQWTGEPPYRGLGRAGGGGGGKDFALGNAGAGLGATAGRLKGGIGSASLALAGGAMVGAIVAVNSWGATVRPDCGRLWAADLALAGEIDRQPPIPDAALDPEDFSQCGAAIPGANTTIAVVATDAALDKRRLPASGDHGAGRSRSRHPPDPHAIRRRHRFCAVDRGRAGRSDRPALLALGSAAADCLARAVMRAVLAAAPLGGVPSWRQLWGGTAPREPSLC